MGIRKLGPRQEDPHTVEVVWQLLEESLTIKQTIFEDYHPSIALSRHAVARIHFLRGDLDDAFARGEFEPLRRWLNENIHQHGRRYRPRELVEKVTGRAPDAAALLSRLETKYGAIHGL